MPASRCEGCGGELPVDARACPSCGRAVGLGQRTEEGAIRAAEKTGEVAGKIGRGLLGGAKGLASGAKKGFKGSQDEKSS